MQEVHVGDTVLLYQPDGSATTRFVVNVISQEVVQVADFEVGGLVFDATNAPIYIRGTKPGQWELMNEEPQEELKRFGDSLRMANHPITRQLHSLLNIKLPADVEEVFLMAERIYADKDVRSPFYEVRHRDKPFNNDDYFYNLLTRGVQEGLRSTFYFLQQFLSWSELVKVQSAAIVADVKPSQSGTFAIRAETLNANYEGFILLSRATLDRLTYFFKYYFQIENRNPSLYALRNNLEEKNKDNQRGKQLLEAIKKHSVFLDTQLIGQVGQPTERNRLAHQEYVGFATPNIRYSSGGTVQVVLIYNDDLQAEATKELNDRFSLLKLFIIDILNWFFANDINTLPHL